MIKKQTEDFAKRLERHANKECLMGALLEENTLTLRHLMGAFNIDVVDLQMIASLYLIREAEDIDESAWLSKTFGRADIIKKDFDIDYGDVEAILLAITEQPVEEQPYVFRFLEDELGKDFIPEFRDVVVAFIRNEKIDGVDFFEGPVESPVNPDISHGGFQEPFEPNKILEEYAENLNIKAESGAFDGLIDYDNTLTRLYTTLCRERKPNAIIVGKAGIGKTSLVEILARNIVRGEAPDVLADKVIYSVNLPEMVGGTEWRGMFEKRLTNFVKEVKDKTNVILFFDEIHTLSGAGGSVASGLEASNILKPALASGDISCIGATTPHEFDARIKSDPALERRFHKLSMSPPNSLVIKSILPDIVKFYETKHPVTYTEEFLENVMEFCDHEMPDRTYPDKLIDVIDFTGARSKMDFFRVPKVVKQLERDLILGSADLNDEEIAEKVKEVQEGYDKWNEDLIGVRAPVEKKHLELYLAENSTKLFTKESFNDFATKLGNNIICQKGVGRFLASLFTLTLKIDNKPSILVVHGEEGSGKSFFLDRTARLLRNSGCEVISMSKLGLSIPERVVGSKNSLAKSLSFHENPVVIIDDFDQISPNTVGFIIDGLKNGFIESFDGEVIPTNNTTFILSVKSKSDTLGFIEGAGSEPSMPTDLKGSYESVFLSMPEDEDKNVFLDSRIADIRKQLTSGEVTVSSMDIAKGEISLAGRGFSSIEKEIKAKLFPCILEGLKKGQKRIDFSVKQ